MVIEKQNEPSVMAKYKRGIFSGVCVCAFITSLITRVPSLELL